MNIFVSKLNFKTREDDLRQAFEEFGEVSSASIILDKETGRSRGFGFVEMPNDDEARAAIEALNDAEFDGRTIVVKEAEPRADSAAVIAAADTAETAAADTAAAAETAAADTAVAVIAAADTAAETATNGSSNSEFITLMNKMHEPFLIFRRGSCFLYLLIITL